MTKRRELIRNSCVHTSVVHRWVSTASVSWNFFRGKSDIDLITLGIASEN